MQRGFFDASALDDDAGLRERYEQARSRRYLGATSAVHLGCASRRDLGYISQALEELEKLRREVGEAKTANEAQTKQHQTNMSLVLRRNEELQLKLKELNGVVEGVVQRELHRAVHDSPRYRRDTSPRCSRDDAESAAETSRADAAV